MAELKDGVLTDTKIIQKLYVALERGEMSTVNAIVVHQTNSSSSSSVFSSYSGSSIGAHFLIDKDGTIYQTARVNRRCNHVGSIRSRCYEALTCEKEEMNRVKGILFKNGQSYSMRVKNLSEHEQQKPFADRFPSNRDSIGIELVGAFDYKANTYESVTEAQNVSLQWLAKELAQALSLSLDQVYVHGDISYKEASEAKTAKWK